MLNKNIIPIIRPKNKFYPIICSIDLQMLDLINLHIYFQKKLFEEIGIIFKETMT